MNKPKILSQKLLLNLDKIASSSDRKRINYNFHPTLNDNYQRFFNVMLPSTYVRPHRHVQENRWELFVAIHGEAAVLIFDNSGKFIQRIILNPVSENIAIEIPPNTWHSIVVTKPNTLLFEGKPGPYQATTDKEFATWAPLEDNSQKQLFVDWFIHGNIGSYPPKI